MGNQAYQGRRSHTWRKLRDQLKTAHHPCYHCGQEIDYTLHWPDPGCFTVDHLAPRATNPELAEDPANLVASHMRCNQRKGTGTVSLSLGNRSEDY